MRIVREKKRVHFLQFPNPHPPMRRPFLFIFCAPSSSPRCGPGGWTARLRSALIFHLTAFNVKANVRGETRARAEKADVIFSIQPSLLQTPLSRGLAPPASPTKLDHRRFPESQKKREIRNQDADHHTVSHRMIGGVGTPKSVSLRNMMTFGRHVCHQWSHKKKKKSQKAISSEQDMKYAIVL